MNSPLKFSLATLLALSTPSCDKSLQVPTSQKIENLILQPTTQKVTTPCYLNDKSIMNYRHLLIDSKEILTSVRKDEKDSSIVYGYICSEEKTSPQGTEYYEVSPISDRNEKLKIEDELRKLGYKGEVNFWKLP